MTEDWICSQCGLMHSEHEVVIRKNGYFYRRDWKGYTSALAEAGRYQRGEAEEHASEVQGVTVHSPSEFAA